MIFEIIADHYLIFALLFMQLRGLSDLDIGAFENFLEEAGQTDLGVD